ncbi:hypothetical protein [Candidatus Viridilinea mediisalina]|uniref:DUF4352 domain-containing protein n=1 Tax=Candidatus Viridilinea mediisalina TaxID=2024553 RepID=A0A2A6RLM8_9CHLR|nr:hypothetical protein [Candidatus Viridilinea mediisalina]PDW03843.1 hypothetical protein CJ255_06730 [Candidatus Viridilinea mediisalina]
MSDQHSVTKLDLEQLLQTGVVAARSGKRVAARALFLALSREHPHDLRVWQGLAATAAHPDEQRMALEQIIALDPQHQRAREALARLQPPIAPVPAPAAPAPPPPPPPPVAEVATPPLRSPLSILNLVVLALIVLLLSCVGMGFLGNFSFQRVANPGLVQQPPAQDATVAPGMVATELPAAPPALTTPTPAASPTPLTTELPLGVVVDYAGWSVTLLQPEYALVLDGALGDLQPEGRFVLAVVAVSNNSTVTRQLPLDFFTLIDRAGRSYGPVPGASSAYLALFERGQRGDLALEDTIAAQSGMLSIPLLFDVPPDAAALRLTTPATGSAGWPIGGGEVAVPMGP